MDYEKLMQIIGVFFWVSILLSCLFAVIRGRVVVIKAFYPQLFLILLLGMGSVQWLLLNISTRESGNMIFSIILLLFCAINLMFAILTSKSQYIVWGMRESAFHEVVQNILRNSKMGFREEGNNQLILVQYPDDIYHHHSMNIFTAGTILKITNKKKEKADQGSLYPKIKCEISGYSMSLSGKLLLIPAVILSLFMLYVYYLVIR